MTRHHRCAATWAIVLAAGGCGDALVGGTCAEGWVARGTECARVAFAEQAPEEGRFTPPECDPGKVACGSSCVELATDPAHCGGCGVSCATGLCDDGVCAGDPVGHVVVIGMDYREVLLGSSAAVLLGNAVFLERRDPVRVLDYRALTPKGAAANVASVLESEAEARSRTLELVTASAWQLQAEIETGDHDVLLIEDQTNAPAIALQSVGSSWADALEGFGARGKTVIVLAASPSMAELLTSSRLLDVSAIERVKNDTLVVQKDVLDAVGIGVLAPFASRPATATITPVEAPSGSLSHVFVTGAGEPVVVHRALVAP